MAGLCDVGKARQGCQQVGREETPTWDQGSFPMSEQSRLGAGGQTKQVWSGGQVQRRLQRQQGLKQTRGPLMPGSQASPICCAAPEVTGPHGCLLYTSDAADDWLVV